MGGSDSLETCVEGIKDLIGRACRNLLSDISFAFFVSFNRGEIISNILDM